MAKNFPNLVKNINLHTQEANKLQSSVNPKHSHLDIVQSKCQKRKAKANLENSDREGTQQMQRDAP